MAQSGKTNAGKVIVSLLAQNDFNVVVYDVHRRFSSVDPSKIKTNLFDIRGKGLEIFQPDLDTDDLFNDFISKCYTFYNCVVVIDELHNFCKKQKAPSGLSLFCRNCNNRNLSYVAIFQAPSEVPSFIVRNAHHRYCFYLDLPYDIDALKSYIGMDVFRFLDEANPVPQFTALYKRAGMMRATEVKFPEFK